MSHTCRPLKEMRLKFATCRRTRRMLGDNSTVHRLNGLTVQRFNGSTLGSRFAIKCCENVKTRDSVWIFVTGPDWFQQLRPKWNRKNVVFVKLHWFLHCIWNHALCWSEISKIKARNFHFTVARKHYKTSDIAITKGRNWTPKCKEFQRWLGK